VPGARCTLRSRKFAVQRAWANASLLLRLRTQILSVLEQSATLDVPAAQLKALAGVEYSQRFAVAFLFDATIAQHVYALGWTARYVSKDEDEAVRFMCWDNLKKKKDEPMTLLVHTSVPFGMTHMDDDKQRDGELLAAISRSVRKLLPFLPDQEEGVLLHRWRYVQSDTFTSRAMRPSTHHRFRCPQHLAGDQEVAAWVRQRRREPRPCGGWRVWTPGCAGAEQAAAHPRGGRRVPRVEL
jgi:predicted NAD/FAD-dependent oxidoreductase